MSYILKIWSAVFHPLIQGFLLLIFLFYSKSSAHFYFLTPESFKWKFILFSFFFLIISPITVYYTSLRVWPLANPKGKNFSGARGRLYPIFAVFYFIFWYTLKDIAVWKEIKVLLFSGFTSIVLLFIALPALKISAHCAGCGLILCFLGKLWMEGWPFFSFIFPIYMIFCGITGSIRILEGAHSLTEVFWGYGAGMVSWIFGVGLFYE